MRANSREYRQKCGWLSASDLILDRRRQEAAQKRAEAQRLKDAKEAQKGMPLCDMATGEAL